MKKILILSLILSLMLPLSSCGRAKPTTYTVVAMDTPLSITLYGGGSAALVREAVAIATDIEKKASATLEDSEVSLFNAAEESYAFSPVMVEILTAALTMSKASGGAYDITVAPLVTLWNVKGGGPVPSDEAIASALTHVGYEKLTLTGNVLTKSDPALKIDLGSVAKGYALGKMADFLTEAGAIGIVNFGGNVALVGEKPDGNPWRVSVRDPFDASGVLGTLTLSGGVVAVSGDYERYFEKDGIRYHHVLSPFDGKPVRGIHTAAVHSADPMEADLLSTALFVLGKEGAEALYQSGAYDFSYLLVLEDGKTVTSPNFEAVYTAK